MLIADDDPNCTIDDPCRRDVIVIQAIFELSQVAFEQCGQTVISITAYNNISLWTPPDAFKLHLEINQKSLIRASGYTQFSIQ